jgi:hypothetical protein
LHLKLGFELPMLFVMAGCEMPRLRAAARRLPQSATATKSRI